jgi:hypothetical protein
MNTGGINIQEENKNMNYSPYTALDIARSVCR